METFKDLFAPIVVIIIVLLVVSVAIALLWSMLGYIGEQFFHHRVKAGTPVRLDSENGRSGWYVVKSRIKDTVELILILPDKPEKDLVNAKTDVTCDISLLKPL